jgi:hypothetical protein
MFGTVSCVPEGRFFRSGPVGEEIAAPGAASRCRSPERAVWRFVVQFPQTPSGKIQKSALRAQYLATL